MLIKVSISVGMVKSLEWWWHLTKLITVYQTDLLHFSTTIQKTDLPKRWVSESVRFVLHKPSGSLLVLSMLSAIFEASGTTLLRGWWMGVDDGSGWAGVDRVGTSPKIPTVFGLFGLVLCWKDFFCWAVLFFLVKKQVSTDGYLLVWGPVVSFSGILGIQTTGPRTNNKPLVEQCLEVFQTSHPICFEVFWKNARWVHKTPRWGTKCT